MGRRVATSSRGGIAGSLLLIAAPLSAQTYVDNTAQAPQASPWNDSWSENLDFADVDGDGDFDCVWADGGALGNDRNRIWINQGGLQGGAIGWFVDETSARMPPVQDSSRDLDFVDLERDGDPDLFVSNSSTTSNQGNRWLVNAGGVQGGTAGFFLDETSTRWINLGINDGSTSFSSIHPSIVFTGGAFQGSFVDWSCDSVFADLDADGDMDLLHSSYGPVLLTGASTMPSRIFLNDGDGKFEEFNPSGFQLSGASISNGDPALWCQGLHVHDTTEVGGSEADIANGTLGVELGDLDGDLDVDVLMGSLADAARIFVNRLEEDGGTLGFRDETYASFATVPVAGTKYEQELGDLDSDDDLDAYGVNWHQSNNQADTVLSNDGSGTFGAPVKVELSQLSDDEAAFLDFDADGDLDVFACTIDENHHLYENLGPPDWTLQRLDGQLPLFSDGGLGTDANDVDLDGDYDIFVATEDRNLFLENTTQAPDTSAPRIPRVEQVLDCIGTPVAVRAHVFDNASWDVVQSYATRLEYSANGGPTQVVPMDFAGGQVWRGELPPGIAGTIAYAVRSTDEHGNTGVSATRSFAAAGVSSYCTAGTSALGCQAPLSSSGTPSASAPSGFVVAASGVEGLTPGLFFFGTSGKAAIPWGTSSSLKCLLNPVDRGALIWSSGTPGACNGQFAYDLNARWTEKPAQNPGPGALVQVQLWYRDAQSTSNQKTAFSDALELGVCPR
jgi:hypothetical protein